MGTMKTRILRSATALFLGAMSTANLSCSKSKDSTPSSTISGYITCPSTGYYSLNGASVSCTPGTTVYAGIGTNGSYTVCPATGYYTSNGMSYPCTPGTTVNTIGTNGGYTICPANGFYTANGVTYTCTPGTQVNTAGTNGYANCPMTGYYSTNGMTYPCTPGAPIGSNGGINSNNNICAQFTARYGVPYVLMVYGGQYVCARYDVAAGNGSIYY